MEASFFMQTHSCSILMHYNVMVSLNYRLLLLKSSLLFFLHIIFIRILRNSHILTRHITLPNLLICPLLVKLLVKLLSILLLLLIVSNTSSIIILSIILCIHFLTYEFKFLNVSSLNSLNLF